MSDSPATVSSTVVQPDERHEWIEADGSAASRWARPPPSELAAARLSCAGVSGTAHSARARWLLDVLAVAAVYIGAALLRLVFPFTEHGASWVWLPSGVALASLLLLGRDRWPGILLGACASSLLSDRQLIPAVVARCYPPAEGLPAYVVSTRRRGFWC